MTEWRESLEGVGFPAIVHLLVALNKTGRLRVWLGSWSADVHLDDGRVVSARFGSEEGLAALEAIIAALNRGEFSFADDITTDEVNVDLEPDVLEETIERMDQEWASSAFEIATPLMVPRPIAPLSISALPAEVVLDRDALETLLALDGRRTVADITFARGVARSFKQLAKLAGLGLIVLEPPSVSPPPVLLHASRPNAALGPLPDPTAAEDADGSGPLAEPTCPRLGFADDPDHHFSRPTRLHRCFAELNPLAISTGEQQRFCLSTGHEMCPRFSAAPADPAALSAPLTLIPDAIGAPDVDTTPPSRRPGFTLGSFLSTAARAIRGEDQPDLPPAPTASAITQRGAATIRRLRPTEALPTLAYLVNCLLDELRLAKGSEILDLSQLMAEASVGQEPGDAAPSVIRNRFDVSSLTVGSADSEATVELLAGLVRPVCEHAEIQLGADRARDTYRAVYAALFSDRPGDERALDLRSRLPYALDAPAPVQL